MDDTVGALGGGSLGTESGGAVCSGGVKGLFSGVGLFVLSRVVDVTVTVCCSVVGVLVHQTSQPDGGGGAADAAGGAVGEFEASGCGFITSSSFVSFLSFVA